MDSVLRQSKAMCPFLKSASPATLRAMSTATRARPSPCGGTMSKLQLYAHRCPVMGKAMAVQSSKYGAAAGIRAFSAQSKTDKARLHTSRNQEARAVESPILDGRKNGVYLLILCGYVAIYNSP
jgi:5-aminolevulinate synthase